MLTPDQLLLGPEKQAQLEARLAAAGMPEALTRCIAEGYAQVADYTRGYTFTDERIEGWVSALALSLAYTRAGVAIPEGVKLNAAAALRELEAVRDGKFPGALATTSPAIVPGAVVTSAVDLDCSLR